MHEIAHKDALKLSSIMDDFVIVMKKGDVLESEKAHRNLLTIYEELNSGEDW